MKQVRLTHLMNMDGLSFMLRKNCVWQSKSGNSLIIVRPTVIFGEGNRGNVFNLFNQIASGKFVMVGKGENKKSMAYIGNVVAFWRHASRRIRNMVYITMLIRLI